MTAGLRQYLMLAGVGAVGGFALIVAILGPGELMKRARSVVVPGNTLEAAVDKPTEPGTTTQDKAASGNRPAAEQTGETPHVAPPIEKQAAISAAKPGAAEAPSLDIVRVEPNGDAVIAGRTAPNAAVEIIRDNKPIAHATADDNGHFAIVPPTLPTGNSELSYRSVSPDGKETTGKESIAIVVAENRATKPLVAVSTPDKPTVVLSRPEPPADAAPDAKTAEANRAPAGKGEAKPQTPSASSERKAPIDTAVQVVSVDAQEGGRLDVTGMARPGATLRLYLNDTLVAAGKAGADGRLAFTIGRGVKPGGYQVRIDQVEPATGKVAQRAQVAFAFPESAGPKLAVRETPATAADKAPVPKGGAEAGRPASPVLTLAKPEPQRQASRADSDPTKKDSLPAASADKAITAERPSTGAAVPGRKKPSDEMAAAPKSDARATDIERRVADVPALRSSTSVPRAETASPAVTPPDGTDDTRGSPSPAASEPGLSEKPVDVFIPEISTAKITRGDNLWQISRRTYGAGLRYTVIFDANKDQIRDPDMIYPGQIFVLPRDEAPKRG